MSAPISPPTTYREAVQAAAALVAARKAPKSATEAAVSATAVAADSIIAARDRASAYAKRAIRQLWARVNPYDDASVAAFVVQAARIMGVAQTAAAKAAAVGQAHQLAAVGVVAAATQSVPLDVRAPSSAIKNGLLVTGQHVVKVLYAGGETAKVTKADMTTQGVFKRPASVYRYARSKGATDADAAALAVQRIDSLIDDNLMLAQRLGQQQVLSTAVVDLDRRPQAKAKIIGYRRVIHPELSRSGTCGLCIAASDRIYNIGELMPIHAHCKCTIAAITEDFDPADDLNAVDLSALYKDAGGTGSALLKRARYKVDEHGELGPVLVPGKAYKPRSVQSKVRASTLAPGEPESKSDIARRHLPILEENLKTIRAAGAAEDSPQVTYHRQQIARMRASIDDEGTDASMPPTPPPAPPTGTGRPGPADGGDDHEDLTPEDHAAARDAAEAKRASAQAAEPEVSAAVTNAVASNGGKIERFDSRFKTADSLYRKMQDLMVESDVDAAAASGWIRDSLRYTVVVDEDGYWAAGDRIGEALIQAGYDRAKVVPGWNRHGYRGRNDTFRGADGLEFEVQIHTAASLRAAEATHGLYEEERLPTTSDDRRAQLRAQQYAIFDAVPVPDDILWID